MLLALKGEDEERSVTLGKKGTDFMEWCQRVSFSFLWLGEGEGQPKEEG